MANKDLNKAKAAKKDEFYTRLEDIEKELKYYRQHFKGKTVLCNCDDPRCSNFFRHFTLNFEVLGLKKVIAATIGVSNRPVRSARSTKNDEEPFYCQQSA